MSLAAVAVTRDGRPQLSGYLFAFYLAVSVLIYVVVRTHTAFSVFARASHDDALFLRLGQNIANGEWLGPYDQFTLMKGPGFPLFLAVGNWLGISVSFWIALFHCAAVTLLTVVTHRFVRSYFLSGVLFALLLWHPVVLSIFLLRVVRESIYYAQVLLFLAAIIGALFYATGRLPKFLFAVLSGAALGWLWLSREEGLWIVPAVVVLVWVAGRLAFRRRAFGRFAMVVVVMLGVFAGIQAGFMTLNWRNYGFFVGVDFKESNYQRALRAIASVRSGGVLPFISITRDARLKAYAESAAFASLKDYFEGRQGRGWAQVSCNATGTTPCDEIAAGHFVFALRDAAASRGHYASPAEASGFFGQLADEIEAACERDALECIRQPIAEMPPVTKQALTYAFDSDLVLKAFRLLLLLSPPLRVDPSAGDDDDLARHVRFLGYPIIMGTRGNPFLDVPAESPLFAPLGDGSATYEFSGWYHRSGSDWVGISVVDADGIPADVRVDRRTSEDIVIAFEDGLATRQRFVMRTRCRDDCAVVIEGRDATVRRPLGELREGNVSVQVGSGTFHVDEATVNTPPIFTRYWAEVISDGIRSTVLRWYQLAFVPALTLGIPAFGAASLLVRRNESLNVCYALAVASWLLVLSRVGLLVLMAATSVTAVGISELYLSPAFFNLVCASVFSIAAWWQLSSLAVKRRARRPAS